MNPAGHGNDKLSREESPARQIARRVIEGRRSESAETKSAARAAVDASGQLYEALSRWLGPDGCHALFRRALAQARTEHPALKDIQLRARSEPYNDGVAAVIMANGDPAAAAGLESMLVHVIELLGRLIGDDMTLKLIERSLALSEGRAAGTDDAREEA